MPTINYRLLRAATLGVELYFEKKEYCMTFATCICKDLSQDEERELGLLIWSRTSRGKNNFHWLLELYNTALEGDNANN